MRLRSWRKAPKKIATTLTSISRQLVPSLNGTGLFRFAVRWDGAGPADLSGWNRPIEGDADRLRPGGDGHLYRGAERIRLFGFNFSSGASFMDPSAAARMAARLARQGVNYVRIAQNSNPAPQGWLDPVTAARLDARALDALDDFVAALGRHGIYVHLVLNHFRRAYPSEIAGFDGKPGLPEGWPPLGTGVTQFYTPIIAQNQAIARHLLTHRNRRNGLAYAEDPAIAVLEVTNEDGLLASWCEGAVDPIIAAAGPHLHPLREELRARWNRWLQARYSSDASLHAAWGRAAPAERAELLTNGDFRQAEHGWRLEARGTRAQSRLLEAGGPRGAALEIQVAAGDTEGWYAILAQDGVPVAQDRPYRISLWARASGPGVRLCAALGPSHPFNRTLGSSRVEWTLTDQWKRYIGRLIAGAADRGATLNLGVGFGAGAVSVAGASVREEPVAGLRAGERPSAGTVAPLSRAGLALRTVPAQRDWVAFLMDNERQFFADAFRFLREELRVRALLIGTQGDRSPAVAQAGSDITSMHAYWAHPSFPERPWDPDHWFSRNRSMVSARDEWHTLNRIAFHRRRDKPLIVDEYNHPQPNTFGAEGFPLAAAYGAFQDWDGIAGWAYREGAATGPQQRWDGRMIRDYFALDADPVRLLSAWLAAVMFRRADVSPGRHLVPVGDGAEEEIARTVGLPLKHEVVGKGAQLLPLRHRVALHAGAAPAVPTLHSPAGTSVVSDTGELDWEVREAGGVVVVDSPRTKAVIGFGGGREFSLGPVMIRPGATAQRGFGVWAVTALDGLLPIAEARRLIIVALGYSQNTNQAWTIFPDRRLGAGPPHEGAAVTLGSAWGRPPTLAEGVPARITLRGTHPVRMWRLNGGGQRGKEVPVRVRRGEAVMDIGRRHRTLWYEVAVANDTR